MTTDDLLHLLTFYRCVHCYSCTPDENIEHFQNPRRLPVTPPSHPSPEETTTPTAPPLMAFACFRTSSKWNHSIHALFLSGFSCPTLWDSSRLLHVEGLGSFSLLCSIPWYEHTICFPVCCWRTFVSSFYRMGQHPLGGHKHFISWVPDPSPCFLALAYKLSKDEVFFSVHLCGLLCSTYLKPNSQQSQIPPS